jgi:hypothetical protein
VYVANIATNNVVAQVPAVGLDGISVEVVCPDDFVACSTKSEVHASSAGK